MKGLDSPALLALLHGESSIRPVLRGWAGEELATTELNLLELSAIAASSPSKQRAGRLETLQRLRRRLTVLPVDARAQQLFSERGASAASPEEVLLTSVFATLESAGCSEVLTGPKTPLPKGRWKVKIRRLGSNHTK